MGEALDMCKKMQDYVKRVARNASAWEKEMEKEAKKKVKETNEQIAKDYGAVQRDYVMNLFKKTVDMFYADYTPDIYHRQYGLKKIENLSLRFDKYGRIDNDTYESFFDDVEMHADRRGAVYWRRNGYFDSLFDLTYMSGWHGGAPSSEDGDHPNEGTPYYRRPKPYYYEWGDEAEYMTPSPFERFKEALVKADSANGDLRRELTRIKNERYEKMAKDIQDNILPVVSRKYFGEL